MKIHLDLTPKLERHLINLGLQALTEQITEPKKKYGPYPKKTGRTLTAAQRRRVAHGMAKYWASQREAKALEGKPRGRKSKPNGKALHGHPAATQNGGTLTRKGAPLRSPNKRWSPEHTAKFKATMAAKRAAGWTPRKRKGA